MSIECCQSKKYANQVLPEDQKDIPQKPNLSPKYHINNKPSQSHKWRIKVFFLLDDIKIITTIYY